MADKLAGEHRRAVGIKQTLKAVQLGQVRQVFLAQDADPELLEALVLAATERGIPMAQVATMKELGRMCGIQVPAAAAALLPD